MESRKKNKPIIAYVGPVAFPDGGAAARRILGNALSLRLAGFDVRIGSGQMVTLGKPDVQLYQGFPVYSLGERIAEHYPTPIKHLFYLGMGRKTRKWLESLNPKPAAIILYSGYSPYFMQLLPWCKRYDVPLIFDAVEWYDPPSKFWGLVSPYYWNIEMAMRHYCVRTNNIIAISSYLDAYYSQRGCNTVTIPPTLDTNEVAPNLEVTSSKVLTIGYTGIPGSKDLFDNYLEAILRIDPKGKHIKMRVAGVTQEQLITYPAIIKRKYNAIPSCVETLGMTTQKQSIDLIRQVDFSVLLRPQQRYAQAGFPTKVVESMTMGTPVIANITSDLGNYLHDGVEGIVCKDHQSDSLATAFEKALNMPAQQKKAMRLAARVQAEKSFDFRVYRNQMADFFGTLLK